MHIAHDCHLSELRKSPRCSLVTKVPLFCFSMGLRESLLRYACACMFENNSIEKVHLQAAEFGPVGVARRLCQPSCQRHGGFCCISHPSRAAQPVGAYETFSWISNPIHSGSRDNVVTVSHRLLLLKGYHNSPCKHTHVVIALAIRHFRRPMRI